MKKISFGIVIAFAISLISCGPRASKPQIGTVVYDTIMNVPCRVYLPMESGQRKVERGETKWPVLYLQHGMWGNEHDWV